MKKSKFPEEQIAYAMRQAESGTAVPLCPPPRPLDDLVKRLAMNI